jgi:hypothetical protein
VVAIANMAKKKGKKNAQKQVEAEVVAPPENLPAPAPVPEIEHSSTDGAMPDINPVQLATPTEPESDANQGNVRHPEPELGPEVDQIAVEEGVLHAVTENSNNVEATPSAQSDHIEAEPTISEPGASSSAADPQSEIPGGGEATRLDLADEVPLVDGGEESQSMAHQSNGLEVAIASEESDEAPKGTNQLPSAEDTGTTVLTEGTSQPEIQSASPEPPVEPHPSLDEENPVAEVPMDMIASEELPVEAIIPSEPSVPEAEQPDQ